MKPVQLLNIAEDNEIIQKEIIQLPSEEAELINKLLKYNTIIDNIYVDSVTPENISKAWQEQILPHFALYSLIREEYPDDSDFAEVFLENDKILFHFVDTLNKIEYIMVHNHDEQEILSQFNCELQTHEQTWNILTHYLQKKDNDQYNDNDPRLCPKCKHDVFITAPNQAEEFIFEPKSSERWSPKQTVQTEAGNETIFCSNCHAQVDYNKSQQEKKIVLVQEKHKTFQFEMTLINQSTKKPLTWGDLRKEFFHNENLLKAHATKPFPRTQDFDIDDLIFHLEKIKLNPDDTIVVFDPDIPQQYLWLENVLNEIANKEKL